VQVSKVPRFQKFQGFKSLKVFNVSAPDGQLLHLKVQNSPLEDSENSGIETLETFETWGLGTQAAAQTYFFSIFTATSLKKTTSFSL
jgi:hypothetical protein